MGWDAAIERFADAGCRICHVQGNGAVFSGDWTYRYLLWRRIPGGQGQTVSFVMLNPSTANARDNDPTVRRCIRFAEHHGFAKMMVVNLSAGVCSTPRHSPPMGVEECTLNCHAQDLAASADLIIAAWGALPGKWRVGPDLSRFAGREMYCFGRCRNGQPRHPLYLPSNAPLSIWPVSQILIAGL